MKRIYIASAVMLLNVCGTDVVAQKTPECADVLAAAQKVNAYFMKTNPDPTVPSFVKRMRPSHIWTRGVYYEGLMALYDVDPDPRYAALEDELLEKVSPLLTKVTAYFRRVLSYAAV